MTDTRQDQTGVEANFTRADFTQWLRTEYLPWKKIAAQNAHDWDEFRTEMGEVKRQLARREHDKSSGSFVMLVQCELRGTPTWEVDPTGEVIVLETVDRSLPVQAKNQLYLQASAHRGRLTKVIELIRELEHNFADIQRRLVIADETERSLCALEECLERSGRRYLSWIVSLLKDVFTYNYPETLTRDQLEAIMDSGRLLKQRDVDCTKDDYEALHARLLRSGLSLLPNSDRVHSDYGE